MKIFIFLLLCFMTAPAAAQAGSVLEVSPASVVFPPTPAATEAGFTQILLRNAGAEDIFLQNLTLTGIDAGDFSLATNCIGQTLPSGADCSAYVALPAVFEGDYSAELEIESSAGLQAVPLTGTITAADNGGCTLDPRSSKKAAGFGMAGLFFLSAAFLLRIGRNLS